MHRTVEAEAFRLLVKYGGAAALRAMERSKRDGDFYGLVCARAIRLERRWGTPTPPPAEPRPAEVLVADTLAAARAAERAAENHALGMASTEALILASDAAFHAARRAERAAEASGCPEMAAAAHRARCAYRAGGRA